MKGYKNYDKYPHTVIETGENSVFPNEKAIVDEIASKLTDDKKIIVIDCYPNVDYRTITDLFKELNLEMICSDKAAVSKEEYQAKIQNYLTDDRVFGFMCHMKIENFFDKDKLAQMKDYVLNSKKSIIVYGVGASLICKGDITIYADLARWEIQLRYRKGATNWNTDNSDAPILTKYKQGFFVEWRFADKHKKEVWKTMDYVLDTNQSPKMITKDAFTKGLDTLLTTPFRLVPYFDPGVWGGQWMKEVCSLDEKEENFAWSFDGVPEENSLYLKYNDTVIEIPAIDLIFHAPEAFLGKRVHGRYGAEFPIRFDLLDTMGGQNLSLQVHPLTEYIQETFGLNYTQDESYYVLDADENQDTYVYLGLRDNVNSDEMIADLKKAQKGEMPFDADKYINKVPAKKHDHFLIPAGTLHCSGANTMILEISATPYIFTFKLWDWGRLGLDGLPRPIHIQHGEKVIQWDRTEKFVYDELVNHFEVLEETDTHIITKTGLHEREPIETVTHRSSSSVLHKSNGSVAVFNLVEGAEAIVESPSGEFKSYVVHYAETFIVPASVSEYTITPYGKSENQEIMTVKAYIK